MVRKDLRTEEGYINKILKRRWIRRGQWGEEGEKKKEIMFKFEFSLSISETESHFCHLFFSVSLSLPLSLSSFPSLPFRCLQTIFILYWHSFSSNIGFSLHIILKPSFQFTIPLPPNFIIISPSLFRVSLFFSLSPSSLFLILSRSLPYVSLSLSLSYYPALFISHPVYSCHISTFCFCSAVFFSYFTFFLTFFFHECFVFLLFCIKM